MKNKKVKSFLMIALLFISFCLGRIVEQSIKPQEVDYLAHDLRKMSKLLSVGMKSESDVTKMILTFIQIDAIAAKDILQSQASYKDKTMLCNNLNPVFKEVNEFIEYQVLSMNDELLKIVSDLEHSCLVITD